MNLFQLRNFIFSLLIIGTASAHDHSGHPNLRIAPRQLPSVISPAASEGTKQPISPAPQIVKYQNGALPCGPHFPPSTPCQQCDPWEYCTADAGLVKGCDASSMTPENWAAFQVDQYLMRFLTEMGSADNFPSYFVSQQAAPGNNPDFACGNMDETRCTHLSVANPDRITSPADCLFRNIGYPDTTPCQYYASPAAAFVVQNYIRLWQGVINNFRAVEDAGNAITNSGFIDWVVDCLSPEGPDWTRAVATMLA
jgi:hypothetical protein